MGVAQIDIVNMIRNAGPVVQFVMLLLLFFSIMSWAIILIKYRYIRRAYKESAEFTDFFWKSRDLSNAFAKAKQLPGSPLARIFRIGYVELKKLSQSATPVSPVVDQAAGSKNMSLDARFTGTDNVKRALRRAITTEMTRMSPATRHRLLACSARSGVSCTHLPALARKVRPTWRSWPRVYQRPWLLLPPVWPLQSRRSSHSTFS